MVKSFEDAALVLLEPLGSHQTEASQQPGRTRHPADVHVRADVGIHPAIDRAVEAAEVQTSHRQTYRASRVGAQARGETRVGLSAV